MSRGGLSKWIEVDSSNGEHQELKESSKVNNRLSLPPSSNPSASIINWLNEVSGDPEVEDNEEDEGLYNDVQR